MKKVLSLLLVLTMFVSILSACGSNDTSSEATESGSTQTTTEETTESADTSSSTGSSDDTINLKWAVWDISSTVYYDPLIEAFESEYPNVNIEMVDLGSQDYSVALATQLSGNDTDLDIVQIKDVPGYVNLVNKGVLSPISTEGLDLSLYNGLADQLIINDVLYTLPFRADFWLTYYNKDIFDAAGVAYPTNDMSFDEYDQIARSLTKTDLGNEVYGAHYHVWRSMVQNFGILDGVNTMVDGNYDNLKHFYEVVLAEQEDGVIQDYATLKTSGLHYSGAFAQGNVAMMHVGAWFIPTLIEKIKTGEYTEIENWGLVSWPHPEGVEAGSAPVSFAAISAVAASDHQEEASAFVEFVSGTKGAAICAAVGTMPAIVTDEVISIISSQDGFPDDEESANALITSNTYLELPINENSSEIDVIIGEAHDSIMTGAMTVDEGIEYMNTEVGKILGQ